jgi:predicted unusual protein kinase regulating ubiquinone biosynthesis (AarF/ABC1/UbiB family)
VSAVSDSSALPTSEPSLPNGQNGATSPMVGDHHSMSVLTEETVANGHREDSLNHLSESHSAGRNPASPITAASLSQPTSPTPYKQDAYRWNRRRYSRVRRYVDIWQFVLQLVTARWLYGKAWSYSGGNLTLEKQALRRRRLAVWIRETLLDLGPTFIKVGQLFSTRADIFPIEFVEELSKLQDRVPAFSYEQTRDIIESDLGKPIQTLFSSFEPIPLAAASLGQVHRARLHSGEEVVVKVQRPGLKSLFTIDLEILKGIAHYFQSHPTWGKGRDWIGIYEECCRILWQEIDYLSEGRNADTFRRNFRGYDWVKVPRVFWRFTSARVLTLEYMPGIKISHYEALDAAGLDRSRLARLGAQAYLHQLLGDGFFHADPHPGNIAVTTEGALIFYDFGMMGQVQPLTRERLMGTFMGIARRDADQVMNSLIELGALAEVEDMSPVRRSIQYILDNFMDKPFEEQSIDAISDDLYAVAYDQPFRFPATFTFVMRAFSTLEGVGKGLDANFNFMEAAKPFAAQLMTSGNSTDNSSSILGELSRQAAQVSTSALGLPRRIEDTLDKLERGDIRVRVRSIETDRALRRISGVNAANSYAILVGAFTLSATILLISEFVWLAIVPGLLALGAGIAFWRSMAKVNRADRMP